MKKMLSLVIISLSLCAHGCDAFKDYYDQVPDETFEGIIEPSESPEIDKPEESTIEVPNEGSSEPTKEPTGKPSVVKESCAANVVFEIVSGDEFEEFSSRALNVVDGSVSIDTDVTGDGVIDSFDIVINYSADCRGTGSRMSGNKLYSQLAI